jgi:hypothetical protein
VLAGSNSFVFTGTSVGIGTTSPSQLLEVQGSAQIGNDSVVSAGLIFARKNTNQVRSHYFLSSQESPTYQWIEGGFFTSEMAGISVANNSGKPYYEQYSPAAQVKAFGFINQTTSGSSFTSTAATASVILYQGGTIALAPTLGSVGIGTTSPIKKLHVWTGTSGASNYGVDGLAIESATNVGLQFMYGNTHQGGITFSDNGGTERGFIYYQHSGDYFQIATNGSEKLRIQSDGNVGIGTTSPGQKLDVAGYAMAGTATYRTTIYGDGSGARINFGTPASIASLGQIGAYGSLFNIDSSNGDISFQFGASEKVRITTGGNVGIGTTSVGALLAVNGNAFFASKVTIKGSAAGTLGNSSGLELYQDSATDTSYLYNYYNGPLLLGTNNTERVRITGGGNVGIGTTSPGYKLDVVENVNSFAASVTNTNTNGSAGGLRIIKSNGGQAALYIDNTGGYGNAATILGGNVGIGSASPAYALDVNGTGRFTAIIETSTRTLKNNIESYSTDINKFKQLEPVSFTWKNTDKQDVGLIAEDVDKLFPEFVSKTDEGEVTGINYGKLSTIFINVLKQQQHKIEELEDKIKKLTS